MKLNIKILYPLICLFIPYFLLLAGCSPHVALTPALIKEYQLKNSDIKKLQLYLSDGILLEQEATIIDKEIDESHALKTTQDSYVNQIHFKKKTPGIPVSVQADRLSVKFEPDDQLIFTLSNNHPKGTVFQYKPDTKSSKTPKRLPDAGYKSWSFIGKDKYKGLSYNVMIKRNKPYLMVDVGSLKKITIDERNVPGMRQGDQ